MQPPAKAPSLIETISQPLVLVLRYLFFVLMFFLLLSIAAGLLMPGQEFGRYAVVVQPGQSCADLKRDLKRDLEHDLAAFNVNQLSFGVREADAAGSCWLELGDVTEEGPGPQAAPLVRAAGDRVTALSLEEVFYVPRYGRAETRFIWLLSLLLAAVALGARLRQQKKQAAES